MVVITDVSIGVSQLLGVRAWAALPKVYAYAHYAYLHIVKSLRINNCMGIVQNMIEKAELYS